jgi:hypothetical protein
MSDILIPGAYWNDNVIDPKAEATPRIKSPPKAFTSIAPSPDFSISILPSTQSVQAGSSIDYTVTITPINGFVGIVTFGVIGLPLDATGDFLPLTVSSGDTTLTISTQLTTPGATSTLTITGTSGALVHSVDTELVVTADSPLLSNLLAFWRLNGNFLDNTGGGLDGIGSKPTSGGTYVSAVVDFVNDGKLFSAANFISYKQARIPNLPQIWRNGGEWSFSAWVRIPTFGGYGSDNTTKYLFSFNGVGPMLRVDWQAGTSKWRLRESSYNSVWAGNMPTGVEVVSPLSTGIECDIPPDDWHHIVITHKLPTRKFYLDGVLQGTGIYSSGAGTNQSNFPSADSCLGGNMFNIATFSPENLSTSSKGMDDVGLWSRELSASEVTMVWNTGTGWTWPFN